MLELKKITKIYQTENFKQKALDEVSLNFRENEFASILGSSGSGKTTLLNIIGGLDQYTSGDLIINETSTKEYSDRDWDTYRNHRIGFVFQSYNLIGHQSVLANVELALTLSGVSKTEREKRAKEALEKVGLKNHINKRPNQLSGGQMQRVAIARALVNDPSIILADEPTGALDSETSVQIMEILKEIAKDKLIIMVTHNPELAEKYSTRIIRLKDGKIISDSKPYNGKVDTKLSLKIEQAKSKKTSMSFKTALMLSLNNLMTKKGRTFLTAFAGSIGIIGIALIMSLSNGVQEYIDRVQKESLSNYPLSIESTSVNFTAILEDNLKLLDSEDCIENHLCTIDDITTSPYLVMRSNVFTNNLKDFKKYLEASEEIKKYVMDIQYIYDVDLQVYSADTTNGITKVNPNTFTLSGNSMSEMNSMASSWGINSSSPLMNTDVFEELIDNDDLIDSQYELVAGKMPENYNELVLVADEEGKIPLSTMYSLDVEKRSEVAEIVQKVSSGEKIELKTINYNYDDFVGKNFKLVLNSSYFENQNGEWVDKSASISFLKNLVDNGIDLKIVGILKVRDNTTTAESGFVGYRHDLAEYVINKNGESAISIAQANNPEIDIFTKLRFDGLTTTLAKNNKRLGVANLDDPMTINIYPKNYDSKDKIKTFIDEYNADKDETNKITYTDYVGVLMSGITTIVNVISYVLIAFVAISLIVSSIMIAIITYISVLERTKEIGILRAIGASKKDISRVFKAETVIEGLGSGIFGIAVTLILCIPINLVVAANYNIAQVAALPIIGGIVLIAISVLLNVIAGLVPAKIASKKDPVEALRSE